jgi:hypothetical protein
MKYHSGIKIVTNMPLSRSSLPRHIPRLPGPETAHPTEEKPEAREARRAHLEEAMSLATDALHKTSNIPARHNR